jgi:nucleotide-binding universal stress UspA family protein
MTYRSLLVFLDQDTHCTARTQAAIGLAKRLGCHLVGLAPTGLVDYPSTPEAAATLGNFAALAWDALREQAERVADRFRDACHAGGLKSFEAVIDESDKAQSLVRHAHCSDLVVLSQADPSASDFGATRDIVEQAVLYSARPTLIVPYIDRIADMDGHAMVAWDDSREAARAVSDALPLLRLARSVQVVSWKEGTAAEDATRRPRLKALSQWLMWQGVSAEVHTEVTGSEIADAMLSRAADFDAGLIVMGAYGHARWTQRVLGGATRSLLDSMTVPVLMSH